jgi:hypothetical protein
MRLSSNFKVLRVDSGKEFDPICQELLIVNSTARCQTWTAFLVSKTLGCFGLSANSHHKLACDLGYTIAIQSLLRHILGVKRLSVRQ